MLVVLSVDLQSVGKCMFPPNPDFVLKGCVCSGGSRSDKEAAKDIDRAADMYLKDGIEAG